MANNIAPDTNVLIYLHDNSDSQKRGISKGLLADNPIISSQAVSEYLNTTRRLLDLSKEELLEHTAALFQGALSFRFCLKPCFLRHLLLKNIISNYLTTIIVASYIHAGCKTLYSEDMQHRLVANKN